AKHAAALRIAARRNKLTKIWLFGSRARGEGRPDSDVDILYRAPKTVSLWEVSAFMADAMDILGVKVDLADIDHLRPEFRDRVLPEAVPI
ncbi:MAG: nucleotidyltransferase family protein, partial [Thermoplasmatota archaeon]